MGASLAGEGRGGPYGGQGGCASAEDDGDVGFKVEGKNLTVNLVEV